MNLFEWWNKKADKAINSEPKKEDEDICPE